MPHSLEIRISWLKTRWLGFRGTVQIRRWLLVRKVEETHSLWLAHRKMWKRMHTLNEMPISSTLLLRPFLSTKERIQMITRADSKLFWGSWTWWPMPKSKQPRMRVSRSLTANQRRSKTKMQTVKFLPSHSCIPTHQMFQRRSRRMASSRWMRWSTSPGRAS